MTLRAKTLLVIGITLLGLLALLYVAASQILLAGVEGGAMLIVSRPILTSDYTGPIRGTLIMGRYLDAAEVERLAQVTHLSLTIEAPGDPAAPSDLRAAPAALSPSTPISVQPLDTQ